MKVLVSEGDSTFPGNELDSPNSAPNKRISRKQNNKQKVVFVCFQNQAIFTEHEFC